MHQTNQALLACQAIRRETQREGLCLASINRQFIQSALWIWDWISFTILEIHSETKCLCYEYRQPLACQWKCLQQEVLSKWDVSILQKYESSLFIIKSNTQTSVVEYITVLSRNARLSLYKLLLLLIFPFLKLKIAYNSDTLKSTQKKLGLQEALIDIHATTLNSECSIQWSVNKKTKWSPPFCNYLHVFNEHILITT